MSAELRAALWLAGAALAIVGSAVTAWPLGLAALGVVLMLRFR